MARDIWPYLRDYECLRTLARDAESAIELGNQPLGLRGFRREPKGKVSLGAFTEHVNVSRIVSREAEPLIAHAPTLHRMLAVLAASGQAIQNYVPASYVRALTLFRATGSAGASEQDPTWGWGALAMAGVQ